MREDQSRDLTSVPDSRQIPDDALELASRHLDRGLVVSVGDPEVLAVDVHELDVKVGDAVLVCKGGVDGGGWGQGRGGRRVPWERGRGEEGQGGVKYGRQASQGGRSGSERLLDRVSQVVVRRMAIWASGGSGRAGEEGGQHSDATRHTGGRRAVAWRGKGAREGRGGKERGQKG